MKIGVSTAILEGYYASLNEIADIVKKCGYNGIEYNFTEWPSEVDTTQINEILDKYNLEISAIGTRHMFLDYNLYLASPSQSIRRKAVAYIKECMKLANTLGAKVVQNGWAFQGEKLERKYKDVWKFALQSLNELAEFTEEYDVIDAIEVINHYESKLINTMKQGQTFLDEIKGGKFKLNIDTYHMNIEEGSIKESILSTSDSIGYVHIADSNRLAPGYGHFPFREFIDALNVIDYDSYIVMEFNSHLKIDECLKNGIEYMQPLLSP